LGLALLILNVDTT